MRQPILALGLILFLFTSSGFCAGLILDEAITSALKNNPEVLIAQQKIEQAKLNLKGIKRINPQLSVSAGYNPAAERRGVGFTVSQDLDKLLFGNKREKQIAQLNINIAQQELETTKQRIIQQVTFVYYDLKEKQAALTLKRQLFESAKKSLEFNQELFNQGKIDLDAMLSKQSQLKEAELNLNQAQNEVKKAESALGGSYP